MLAKKKALEEAYELDPAFPLIHLALASVEADPDRAAFLRDFDLKRLPDSCSYGTDLDPAEITLDAAEMCAEQKDWPRALVALNKYVKVGQPNSRSDALRAQAGLTAKAKRHMPGRVVAPMTGVALEWHQPRCLEVGRLMRGSASLNPMRPVVPLSMDSPVVSARRSCPRSRNPVQDWVWSKFLAHQADPCVVESHHSVRRPFCAYVWVLLDL
jgi:hypothetical protein